MSGIIFIVLLFIIISLVMSMFWNQGRNYRGRDLGQNDQYMNGNNTLHNGAQDMNFNGIPDYMEPHGLDRDHDGIPDHMEPFQVDTDHDGIPDYMDPSPVSFDGGFDDNFSGSDFGGSDFGSSDFGGGTTE